MKILHSHSLCFFPIFKYLPLCAAGSTIAFQTSPHGYSRQFLDKPLRIPSISFFSIKQVSDELHSLEHCKEYKFGVFSVMDISKSSYNILRIACDGFLIAAESSWVGHGDYIWTK